MENWNEKIRNFFVVRKQQDLKTIEWEKQKERNREEKINKIVADKNKRLAEVRYSLETVGVQELLEKVKRDVWKRGSIHDLFNNNYDKELVGLELRHIRKGSTMEGGHEDLSGNRSSSYSVGGWVVDSLIVSLSESSVLSTGPQLYIADMQSFYQETSAHRGKIDFGDRGSSWYFKEKSVPFVDRRIVGRNVEDALLQLCKERILARKLPTDPS